MTLNGNPNGKDGASEERTNPDAPEETAFQRFEKFVRRVISVPKAEIEEREREYQENRKDARVRTAAGPPQSSISK